MNELRSILAYHIAHYPLMRVQDAFKLLYQNEFGCGHLVRDEEHMLARLQQECFSLLPDASVPFTEMLGNGLCRLNLHAVEHSERTLAAVNRAFFATAGAVHGNLQSYIKKLNQLPVFVREGLLPFSEEELLLSLSQYAQGGYGMLSHTEEYRREYSPAYRVMKCEYAAYLPLLSEIERLISRNESVVLAIDGHAGAGKSTLANMLSSLYGAQVIRMDDFFLPEDMRSAARYAEAGGNIHYERFLSDVLLPLKKGRAFTYRAYDCASAKFEHQRSIAPTPFIIIEGSYAHHPKFAQSYDLRVFLDVSHDLRRKRLLARNGQSGFADFEARWIPLEEAYFEAFNIKENADIVFMIDEA